ncbi:MULTISPECIES: hypothetical protein [unclassified Sinorhizobium]|uniref:hypothetical protein n=1 Tax=unclassified Sinorhizobium TaxID=2613772 RepID=UPI0035232146
MSDCGFKLFDGCACKGECQAKPYMPPPLIVFSWRDHLAVCLAAGLVAGFTAFGLMAAGTSWLACQRL